MSRLFERPNCEQCEKLHASKKTEPPCGTCTPALFSENQDIVEVYLMCCNQVKIAPMGGVVDIDVQAVDTVVKRLHKSDLVFEQAVNLARHFIKEDKKK